MEQIEGQDIIEKYIGLDVKDGKADEKEVVLSFEKKALFIKMNKSFAIKADESLAGLNLKAVIGAKFEKEEYKNGRIYLSFKKENEPAYTLSFKSSKIEKTK